MYRLSAMNLLGRLILFILLNAAVVLAMVLPYYMATETPVEIASR